LREFSDVSVLPTPAFFYGLELGDEITVSIEEGKTLFIKLMNVSAVDKDGRLTLTFELNGMTTEAHILTGRHAQSQDPPESRLTYPMQVSAPIPGLIVTIGATVGQKFMKGDRLLMMEAMKMQTTVHAPMDGVVEGLHVQVGDTVEARIYW
jgi:pyruvate carboxylase